MNAKKEPAKVTSPGGQECVIDDEINDTTPTDANDVMPTTPTPTTSTPT
jgi:hypothetical protein